MQTWLSKNVRYLLLVLMLGAATLGVTLTDAATPTASPTAIASPSPQASQENANSCPSSATAEQWDPEVRAEGTTRLSYQRTVQGNLVYISSQVCRNPGEDVESALYPANTVIVVDSGELVVKITSGIARINVDNSIVVATIGDTFTLLPGDALIIDSGVQAEFPATTERTILNVLTITFSSVPTGCTSNCWLP